MVCNYISKKKMKLKQQAHHITKKKKRISKEFISSLQSDCILAQCCLQGRVLQGYGSQPVSFPVNKGLTMFSEIQLLITHLNGLTDQYILGHVWFLTQFCYGFYKTHKLLSSRKSCAFFLSFYYSEFVYI